MLHVELSRSKKWTERGLIQGSVNLEQCWKGNNQHNLMIYLIYISCETKSDKSLKNSERWNQCVLCTTAPRPM